MSAPLRWMGCLQSPQSRPASLHRSGIVRNQKRRQTGSRLDRQRRPKYPRVTPGRRRRHAAHRSSATLPEADLQHRRHPSQHWYIDLRLIFGRTPPASFVPAATHCFQHPKSTYQSLRPRTTVHRDRFPRPPTQNFVHQSQSYEGLSSLHAIDCGRLGLEAHWIHL